jgi:hypothetical protein
MGQPFAVRNDRPTESGRQRNRIVLDLVRGMTFEASADNEKRLYTDGTPPSTFTGASTPIIGLSGDETRTSREPHQPAPDGPLHT